jgi:hypothetical protein
MSTRFFLAVLDGRLHASIGGRMITWTSASPQSETGRFGSRKNLTPR